MNFSIDTDMVKNLFGEALLASLDQNKREILIKNALQHLMSKGSESWNRVTPLEQAFNHAVSEVAKQIASELLTNDTVIQDKIRSLLNEALVRVLETNREQTVNKLAAAITEGLAYKER